MAHTREEEAGIQYQAGARAVMAGGHELHLLASHLTLMLRGTRDFPGPLWPVRLSLPDRRRKFHLDWQQTCQKVVIKLPAPRPKIL